MDFRSVLTLERTYNGLNPKSKKRLLETATELIVLDVPSIDKEELYKNLITRERLGSTGIGKGVAIPHCRSSQCDHPIGAMITLDTPVDYDAVDNQPVDIVFVLIVPTEETDNHLKLLASLAESLSQDSFRQQLRLSTSRQELFNSINNFTS